MACLLTALEVASVCSPTTGSSALMEKLSRSSHRADRVLVQIVACYRRQGPAMAFMKHASVAVSLAFLVAVMAVQAVAWNLPASPHPIHKNALVLRKKPRHSQFFACSSLCLSKIRKGLNGQALYFLLALHSLSFDAYLFARTAHHLAFGHPFMNCPPAGKLGSTSILASYFDYNHRCRTRNAAVSTTRNRDGRGCSPSGWTAHRYERRAA
jgi:hypothetical protein